MSESLDNLRIDASSEEALRASLSRINSCLREEERVEFSTGLLKIQAEIFKTIGDSSCATDDPLDHYCRCLHDLTFKEVMQRAEGLTTDLERTLSAIARKGRSHYADLSKAESVYYTVSGLTISIRNGGLISYYYNSYADHVADCMEALRTLNAEEALNLVGAMNSLFGESVPKDQQVRNDIIETWDGNARVDAVLKKVEAREQKVAQWLDRALDAYVRREFAQA